MYRSVAAALGSLSLVLACGSAAADEPASNANAMRVAIDKQTGKLRAATAQEAAELARLEAREQPVTSDGQPVPATEAEAVAGMRLFPSGFIGMEVPLSLYSSLEASVGPDGTLTIQHTESESSDAATARTEEARDDLR
jgi:hypothetical protein